MPVDRRLEASCSASSSRTLTTFVLEGDVSKSQSAQDFECGAAAGIETVGRDLSLTGDWFCSLLGLRSPSISRASSQNCLEIGGGSTSRLIHQFASLPV